MKLETILVAAFFAQSICGRSEPTRISEPAELIRARQKWIADKESALVPINQRYTEALNGLRVRFTKEGNLGAALAIERELKAVEAAKAGPFIGEWLESSKKDVSRPIIIRSDYTISDKGNGNEGTWEISGGSVIIRWQTGYIVRMPLEQSRTDVVQGTGMALDGKGMPIVLRRIK